MRMMIRKSDLHPTWFVNVDGKLLGVINRDIDTGVYRVLMEQNPPETVLLAMDLALRHAKAAPQVVASSSLLIT